MNIDALTTRGMSPQTPSARRHDDAVAQAATTASAAPAAAAVSEASKAPPTIDQVHAAAEQIAKFLKTSGRSLDFHVDNDTGQVVVSVRDATSGDLIRQMPSEEALHLARTLTDGSKSLVNLLA